LKYNAPIAILAFLVRETLSDISGAVYCFRHVFAVFLPYGLSSEARLTPPHCLEFLPCDEERSCAYAVWIHWASL